MTDLAKAHTRPFSKHQSQVLVVDDEPKNLQLVGEILRRDGIKFIFATDGAEALEAAKEQSPGLILLDVMMPVANGLDVCKSLKSDSETENIPVIFLTAAAEANNIISGFAAGGVDYIKKPFIQEELLARVRTHLSLYETQQQLNDLYSSKSKLITTLAHDIKNPSSALAGIASVIIEDIEKEKFVHSEIISLLDLVRSSARAMTDLVNEILDEANAEENHMPLFIDTENSVSEIIQHLVKLNELQAKEKSIVLHYKPSYFPSVGISRRILTEVFDNLLSNAVKYSKPNSKITIRLLPAIEITDGLRVEVEDTADLINPSVQETLFQNFSKGPNTHNSQQVSHGVGLAIVKRLIQLYKGMIGIKHRGDGNGNIFFVEIPLSS